MAWLTDQVPWYVWALASLLGIGGTTVALIIFVPAALPTLIAIWRWCPLWLKVLLIGLTGGLLAGLAMKDAALKRERERQRALEEGAVRNREEIDREVEKLEPSEVDRRLRESGDFRDD